MSSEVGLWRLVAAAEFIVVLLLAVLLFRPGLGGDQLQQGATVAAPSTTTSSTILTTTSSTTTTTTSTTTTLFIRCKTNLNCGEAREERICYKGDVYLQRVSWLCEKAGTPESYCVKKTGFVGQTMMNPAPPLEECGKGCLDGACL